MADPKISENLLDQTEMLEDLSLNTLAKGGIDSTVQADKKPRLTMKPFRLEQQKSEDNKSVEEGSLMGESDDEESFDSFILNNFNPFSGMENVTEWLDVTDEKFHIFKLSRKQRYVAIPLLVTGDAKRTFRRSQGTIKSYDDFYTLLLTRYDVGNSNTQNPSARSYTSAAGQGNLSHDLSPQKNVVFDDQRKSLGKTFDLTDSSPQPPILRSTALVDLGATEVIGDVPVNRSNVLASHNSFFDNSQLDQTAYALRRAIVDSLIKNPKTFRGGKEDVKQWLEDINQLFDTAQIPEGHKLDLVQYSLRGEASRWFKNNKSTFTSWTTFVKAFKDTFLSPFHEEIAFKKLESYSQGINQPVRSFYNEIVKLCSEADSSMSDSSKLRYLLNKAKPSLQFEIRKKKPTTTKQFLEFAIEVEELFHLSNIDLPNNTNTTPMSSTITTSRQNTPPPKTDTPISSTSAFEQTYDDTHNNHTNFSRLSHPSTPSPSPFRPNNPSRKPWMSQAHSSSSPSHHVPVPQGEYFHPPQHQSYTSPDHPHRRNYNPSNSRHYNNNQQKHYNSVPRANNISHNPIPSLFDPLPFSSSPLICSHCNRQGHQASACPHF